MSQPYESPRVDAAESVTPLGRPDVTDTFAATADSGGSDPDAEIQGKAAAAKEQAAGVAADAKDQAASVAADAREQGAGVAEQAKEQVADVGAEAKAGGEHVADVAKEEARQVAAHAGEQVKTVMANARTELNQQVNEQQNRLVEMLKGLGDELNAMATGQPAPASSQGLAADLATQGANRVEGIANFLAQRDPSDVVAELTRYARRRPGMFLMLAGVTGVVAGRMTRSLRDDSTQPQQPSPAASGAGTHRLVADYSMSDTATMPTGYGAAVPPPVTEADVHGQGLNAGERLSREQGLTP